MNPAGDLLRIRCRNYPGLVNSTTIDWMFPWPDQALMAVANVTLRDVSYNIEFVFVNHNAKASILLIISEPKSAARI